MDKFDSNTESSSDLLTTEQVMDILVADANLRRRAATCVLPGVCIDGQTYFRRGDLAAWRDSQIALAVNE